MLSATLRSLHGNFFISIVLRGAAALVALGANVVLARVLGVTEYGRYMTLYSAAIVLGSLAVRGTDQLLTRELSAGAAAQPEWRRTLGRWCLKRVAIGIGVATLIYIVWSLFTSTSGSGWSRGSADFAALMLIALFSTCMLIAGALNGFGASQRSQSLAPLINNGVVLLVVGGLWFGAIRTIGSAEVLWMQATGYMLACGLGWYWLHRLTQSRAAAAFVGAKGVAPKPCSANWKSASRNFLFITIAAVLVNRLDVVLVSMLGGTRAAGIYVAGARLAQIALLVAASVNTILAPRISLAWSRGEAKSLRHLMRSGLLFTVIVSVGEAVLAALFAPDIVKIFGGAYTSSASTFVWVVVAYALWTLAAPVYSLLSMTGNEKTVALLSWVVLVPNVVAMVLLVPLMGATGGAVAMAIGYGSIYPALIVLMRKNMKVVRTVFY